MYLSLSAIFFVAGFFLTTDIFHESTPCNFNIQRAHILLTLYFFMIGISAQSRNMQMEGYALGILLLNILILTPEIFGGDVFNWATFLILAASAATAYLIRRLIVFSTKISTK